MAGSRLDRIGTIFSRMTGLLKTGAVKYQDRPIWYDVYQVFPPKYEPQFDRKPELKDDVPSIMYREDIHRAKFFNTYGSNPGGEVRNISEPGFKESCQIFIQKCSEIEIQNPSWSPEQVFEVASRDVSFTTMYSGMDAKPNVSKEESLGKEFPTLPDDKLRPKKSIVTVESLLKLFNEAKEEKENKPKSE